MASSELSGSGAYAPRYQRIADQLRASIRSGELAPGEQIPAETDLANRHAVSLPTIRKAIGVLRSEGLLESRQGIGTFVRQERRLQRRSRGRYGRARGDQKLLTNSLRHEILGAGVEPAPASIAEILGIEPGEQVIVRRRLLHNLDDDRPQELGASFIPRVIAAGTFLEQPTVVPKALFLCIEDLSGRRYARAYDQWIARPATPEEAAVLELAPGTPVVHVTHTARGEDGTVLEISESIWPADRIIVVDEYEIEAETPPVSPSEV